MKHYHCTQEDGIKLVYSTCHLFALVFGHHRRNHWHTTLANVVFYIWIIHALMMGYYTNSYGQVLQLILYRGIFMLGPCFNKRLWRYKHVIPLYSTNCLVCLYETTHATSRLFSAPTTAHGAITQNTAAGNSTALQHLKSHSYEALKCFWQSLPLIYRKTLRQTPVCCIYVKPISLTTLNQLPSLSLTWLHDSALCMERNANYLPHGSATHNTVTLARYVAHSVNVDYPFY
jgi:hypothetical protein